MSAKEKLQPNKRMQIDHFTCYARGLAADAGRWPESATGRFPQLGAGILAAAIEQTAAQDQINSGDTRPI